jgi:hypothetical protein
VSGCLFCGAPQERLHHPTGKDHRADYLDPQFRCPVCHTHHELLGDDRRTLGLEVTERPLSFFERLEIRLRRVGSDLARLVERYPDNAMLAKFAAAVVRWADELAHALRQLDRRDPGWRHDPSFYPPDAGPETAGG